MINVVIDASVVAKWFLQDEPGANKAEEIRKQLVSGNIDILVPELIFLEIGNLLVHKSHLPTHNIADFIDVLYEMNFSIVPFVKDFIEEWVGICRKCKISSYDGIYVVIAKTFSCPFITSDYKLSKKLKGTVEVKLI